jgi:hypothetical protein
MPEPLLLIALFAAVSAMGLLWPPLLLAVPALVAVLMWVLGTAIVNGWSANPPVPGRSSRESLQRRALTALLYLLQPVARLAGRLRNGLSPWRRRIRPGAAWPRARTVELWSGEWHEPKARVQQLQDALAARGGYVRSGGPFDRWDLDLRTGPLGGVKIRVAVEEHGEGRQLLRARISPLASAGGALLGLLLSALAAFAWHQGRAGFAVAIGGAVLLLVLLAVEGTGTATGLAGVEIARLEDGTRRTGNESTGPHVHAASAPWESILSGTRRTPHPQPGSIRARGSRPLEEDLQL